MVGFGQKYENNKKGGKKNTNFSIDSIIYKAFLLHSQGNIKEAEKYYKYCIEKNINDYRLFSNYGLLLKNNGDYKKAEISLGKYVQQSVYLC